jgi:uncharacterized repeat protein (TIGR03803 family)
MDGTGFMNLHDFSGADGAYAHGPVEGSDGALYGTTSSGGAHGFGVVFKVSKDGASFGTLHDFSRSDGALPQVGVIEGSDGALYGTAWLGGAPTCGLYGCGVVFRINKDGTGFRKLHEFGGADGAFAVGGLAQASDGAFYGTTERGGADDAGVVFRLALTCVASLQVDGEVQAQGSIAHVRVHIAHHRPKTVTVSWELRLIDASRQVILKRAMAPHTFKPGDVVDKEVEFQLPHDLASDTYTLELAVSGMAGTKGATTTFRVVAAE